MPRSFKPLQPLRGWRRVATQAWRPPEDPSVYAHLDIPMRSALAYVERLREETGVRITVTHLVARGVALALRQYPQLNGIVARGRIMLRDTVDIFLQVAIEGGTELSGIKIARADEKSVLEIAREMEVRVERLRARRGAPSRSWTASRCRSSGPSCAPSRTWSTTWTSTSRGSGS